MLPLRILKKFIAPLIYCCDVICLHAYTLEKCIPVLWKNGKFVGPNYFASTHCTLKYFVPAHWEPPSNNFEYTLKLLNSYQMETWEHHMNSWFSLMTNLLGQTLFMFRFLNETSMWNVKWQNVEARSTSLVCFYFLRYS